VARAAQGTRVGQRLSDRGSQEANKAPLPPQDELAWWYQFYFETSRGRSDQDKYRREIARLIWKTASPRWNFDYATFERSAQALDNPDHVDITISNDRWRLGLADGERQYDHLEQQLSRSPVVHVPTITMEGDANGAPHPEPGAYARQFVGPYAHRLIGGGVGHNLPQESPRDFAQAILDVAALGAGPKRSSWRGRPDRA
jgi:pimeloyl-ACP methyl ester carboxylesterase